jgi:hypothetical protein
VFTDFTNGGFGPGAFGIRPVEDDITGWSLCGGIVEEGFAIDTTGAFFNNAGVFVPGRFNADSGSGVIGLGENQNVRFEGGTVFEAWLYVLADYSQNDVPDTTYGSVSEFASILFGTPANMCCRWRGWESTIELSLPSGVFPTPTSNTIGFAPWNAEVSFSNYRWDLSSGRRVVCNAAYRLAVNGTTLEGTATGIDLGGVIDFGIQIVPGPVTPVDPTVSAGVPTNAFGTDVPFSYFPTSFYPDFIGFIGYFILGDERTIALEDVTAFETAYARTFADYTPIDMACRGSHTLNDIPYFVLDDKLVRIEADGTSTALAGTITGSGPVSMAENGTQLCILDPGGDGFIYTTAGGLVEITDSDFRANGNPTAVTYIDGYFLFTTDTKKIIVS